MLNILSLSEQNWIGMGQHETGSAGQGKARKKWGVKEEWLGRLCTAEGLLGCFHWSSFVAWFCNFEAFTGLGFGLLM